MGLFRSCHAFHATSRMILPYSYRPHTHQATETCLCSFDSLVGCGLQVLFRGQYFVQHTGLIYQFLDARQFLCSLYQFLFGLLTLRGSFVRLKELGKARSTILAVNRSGNFRSNNRSTRSASEGTSELRKSENSLCRLLELASGLGFRGSLQNKYNRRAS